MNHPFFSSANLHDGSYSIEDLHDLSIVDISNFDIFQDSLDKFQRLESADLVFCSDGTLSIVLKIYLNAEFLFNTLDCFSTLTDHFAHLLFQNKY